MPPEAVHRTHGQGSGGVAGEMHLHVASQKLLAKRKSWKKRQKSKKGTWEPIYPAPAFPELSINFAIAMGTGLDTKHVCNFDAVKKIFTVLLRMLNNLCRYPKGPTSPYTDPTSWNLARG